MTSNDWSETETIKQLESNRHTHSNRFGLVFQPTCVKPLFPNMIRFCSFGKQALSPTGSSLFTEATMSDVCME